MKIVVCFLALATYALASPADFSFETPDELDVSNLTPSNIYLEPVNPVDSQPIDLPASRVIGGNEVVPNSIPYQAAIIINRLSFCGGSLISANRVLTAAHCTQRATYLQIRLGAHRYNTNEATQIRVTSRSVVNHADFEVGGFAANDVAVVILPSAVTLNNNVAVIPLAPANAPSYAGSRALLAGWGRTTDSSSSGSAVLRSVELNIISNAVCGAIYGDNILTSSLCTSGAGIVGACNGDSGGPLAVNGVQVGLVSFGSRQCESGNPTVFARISSFRDWIAEKAGV